MYDKAIEMIGQAKNIVIIQAENPDGDSLGSALALDEILADNSKSVELFCSIDIPKYMRYIRGWDRVTKDWTGKYDLAIIVDTSSKTLLQQTLETPGIGHFFQTHKVLIIDHHQTEGDLPFAVETLLDTSAVATGEVVYNLASNAGWAINPQAAENMFVSIQADSLGLTTPATTASSYRVAAELVALGANPAEIEERRREYMKKPADILEYKGRLIERIQYFLDGELAIVHIPWEEIEEYSDRYNPSVLVLEEMRLVDTVKVAVAIKTYPDGKLTGKIRANLPIAHTVAGYFGGGGHEYAAGFKVYEEYDKIIPELLNACDGAIEQYEA